MYVREEPPIPVKSGVVTRKYSRSERCGPTIGGKTKEDTQFDDERLTMKEKN